MEKKLSVVIHTKDVADTLEKTLLSVQFADEIVIIDMESTDKTLKIAEKYTKKIFHHKDVGYADIARNYGLSKTQHPWILVVDADEVVSEELRQHIVEVMNDPDAADVYFLPRKNFVFEKWIVKTGWWPDYQPRLFKRGMVEWQEGVHRLPDIKGSKYFFPPEESFALEHANYTNVEHFIKKLDHYTSIQAKERLTDSQPFTAETLFERFANELAKRSLMMDGTEEGLHGISLSFLQATYEAVIYLKQWGNQGFANTQPEDFGRILSKVQKIWRYWWADYQVRHSSGIKQIYWRVRRKFSV